MVFENGRIRVFEDRVLQPDGSASTYTVVEEQAGAVVVVAVDQADQVVLLRQHRYPIDVVTLEVPGGEVPFGQDPLDQAQTELRDETGVEAGRLEPLAWFAPWPARVRRWSLAVLATELDVSHLAIEGQGEDEAIHDVRLYSRAELVRLMAAGEIVDGNTLCSLGLYWAKFPGS